MDWACRHPSAVCGIVYFETQVRPRSWDEFSPAQRGLFERLRSPEGEEMVLQQNVFVETLLPLWIIRRFPTKKWRFIAGRSSYQVKTGGLCLLSRAKS